MDQLIDEIHKVNHREPVNRWDEMHDCLLFDFRQLLQFCNLNEGHFSMKIISPIKLDFYVESDVNLS